MRAVGEPRYLREGNAIFGQYTLIKIKEWFPVKEIGKEFLVRKFSNLSDATRSYIKNLNTHPAYDKFSQERRNMRMSGELLSGKQLANYLTSYSERR